MGRIILIVLVVILGIFYIVKLGEESNPKQFQKPYGTDYWNNRDIDSGRTIYRWDRDLKRYVYEDEREAIYGPDPEVYDRPLTPYPDRHTKSLNSRERTPYPDIYIQPQEEREIRVEVPEVITIDGVRYRVRRKINGDYELRPY